MNGPSPKVIVAGLGVMGGAVAHQLTKRGAHVVGVDQFDPPHSFGSSHGDTRIIRAAYFEGSDFVPAAIRAIDLWRQLEEEVGGVLFTRTGVLLVGPAEKGVIAGAAASADRWGVPVVTMEAEAIGRRLPTFRPGTGMVGLLESGAGVLDAEGCVAAQLVAAEALGAELRTGERVLGWSSTADGVEVHTEHGPIRGDRLVLAAGPWIRDLVPSLPVALERQVMHWFAPRYAAASVKAENCPAFLFDLPGQAFYGVPDFGRGVKAALHHGGEALGRPGTGGEASEEEAEGVRALLERHVPAAAGAPLRSVTCHYTNTATGSFIVDHLPGEDRVVVVSACSGHGFKFAPAIGEATASLLLDERRLPLADTFLWPTQPPAN